MKLYRFSPIGSAQECQQALEYVAEQLRVLSAKVMDESLPINTLKIFAHYSDEYAFLRNWVDSLGEVEDDNSHTSYYVKPSKTMTVAGEPIEYVGIRTPDPYRSHVGCGDFVVDNYDELKKKYLGGSPWIREVEHSRYEMLELFHPDIDVLGYIVKE